MQLDKDALEKLVFNEAGLIPAIVQSFESKRVLMLAWMNRESIEKSIEVGETIFFSRSRDELWHKGATSGNTQRIVRLEADCDSDSLLISVVESGPACHTNAESCFDVHPIVEFGAGNG